SGIRARIRPLGTLNQGEARYPLDYRRRNRRFLGRYSPIGRGRRFGGEIRAGSSWLRHHSTRSCHLFVYDPHAQPNHSMTLDNRADRARHPLSRAQRHLLWPLFLALSIGLGGGASVTIDASKTYQVIEGFGVNANHRSWNNDLKPVLDQLIDE